MFKVTIKTENDAFAEPDGAAEVSRILQRLAADVGYGETSGILYDVNGNRVGTYKWEGR